MDSGSGRSSGVGRVGPAGRFGLVSRARPRQRVLVSTARAELDEGRPLGVEVARAGAPDALPVAPRRFELARRELGLVRVDVNVVGVDAHEQLSATRAAPANRVSMPHRQERDRMLAVESRHRIGRSSSELQQLGPRRSAPLLGSPASARARAREPPRARRHAPAGSSRTRRARPRSAAPRPRRPRRRPRPRAKRSWSSSGSPRRPSAHGCGRAGRLRAAQTRTGCWARIAAIAAADGAPRGFRRPLNGDERGQADVAQRRQGRGAGGEMAPGQVVPLVELAARVSPNRPPRRGANRGSVGCSSKTNHQRLRASSGVSSKPTNVTSGSSRPRNRGSPTASPRAAAARWRRGRRR